MTSDGGMVICISNVMAGAECHYAFSGAEWEMHHGGGLAFAPDREATIDLGVNLYS